MTNETLPPALAGQVERGVRPQRADVVPGVVHCVRCKFRLVRTDLNVRSGRASAGNSDTEPCPNGCGPLWPVSWEQEAREGWETCEQFFARAMAAEDALKNLHEVCRDCDLAPQYGGPTEQQYTAAMDAAEAVLGPNV